MNRLMPKRLATRLSLVVAGGLLLSLGAATGFYLADRQRAVETTVESGAQACLTALSGALLSQPASGRQALLQSWTEAGIGLAVHRPDRPPPPDRLMDGFPPDFDGPPDFGDRPPPPRRGPPGDGPPPFDPMGFGARGGGPPDDPYRLGPSRTAPQPPREFGESVLTVSQTLPDGSALTLPARWPAGMSSLDLSVWIALSLVGLAAMLLSLWAVRRALEPLGRLAAAADAISGDLTAAPLPETGPEELSRTAAAFNRLFDRLRRAVAGRSRVFAALSHDLRTPLTRLRLRAELMEDDEIRARTLSDLDEMQSLVQSALAYARDQAVVETPGPVDLGAQLSGLAAGMKSLGRAVEYRGPASALLTAGPGSLQRVFGNLVENALRHAGNARIGLAAEDGVLVATVEDDGPGIPDDQLSKVLEPFYRIESSRNRETGGAGLGLAVVDELVRGMGGTLALANRAPHGLIVTIRLPRQR